MEEQLTTRQVAQALSVSESSVKRWCNGGAIATVRTVGGHRRIPMAALQQFLKATHRPFERPGVAQHPLVLDGEAAAQGHQLPVTEESSAKLLEALIVALAAGDEQQTRTIVSKVFTCQPSVASLADQYIAPAFERLGESWSCDALEVYQERRACEICSRLFHELRESIPTVPAHAPLALGASPEADYYTLPSQLVELVLRENGWRSMNMGSNLPLSTLLSAVRHYQPRMLWLSISYLARPEEFVKQYDWFRSQLPQELLIVVGGRALTDDLRPRIAYSAHCDTLRQLANFVTAVTSAGSTIQSFP